MRSSGSAPGSKAALIGRDERVPYLRPAPRAHATARPEQIPF